VTDTAPRPRILLVDDEPSLLDGLRRQLRRDFSVEVATSGAEGLIQIRENGPFVVVVSDFRMPNMDGAAFLAAARSASPDTTRILLSGQADLTGTAAVVNEGQVFRMLLKPITPEVLTAALRDGVAHHHMVVAERELLEQTLQGSVKALIEVLALINPALFARVGRLRRLVGKLLDELQPPDRWTIELAAALSQLGMASLPPAVTKKIEAGAVLAPAEQHMVDQVPAVTEQLLSGIPRLGPVITAIRYSRKGYDGSGYPDEPVAGEQLPLGSRILRIVEDFEEQIAVGAVDRLALSALSQRSHLYDPHLLATFAGAVGEKTVMYAHTVAVADLAPGMVLDADMETRTGVLLISRGQEITPSLLTRIRNFARMEAGVAEPVAVLSPHSG
jgi:response regulator RpfG family c-di-GMP phosphodiesterase